MKLALVIDDYLPESTKVGAKMFHELALELQKKGHKVIVVTPEVNTSEKLRVDKIEGVEVWRFRSGPFKGVNKILRATNETLFSLRAWSALKSRICKDTFDGIIYYSPSIFFGRLVKLIKKRCNCHTYLVLRDSFPQWAIDAGLIKGGSIIEKYFRFFERQCYLQADMIGLMSDENKKIFDELTHKKYISEVLRNWADVSPPLVNDRSDGWKRRLNLSNKTIFFYGGNIGHAQDMANLMRLVKSMVTYEQAHFLFVGSGDQVELIKQLAHEWELSNFTYLPSVGQREFKELLSIVDVGLFSLAKEHTSHNFPGKLLGYMVNSIPILGSVNVGNDLMGVINDSKAGYVFINGEDDKLTEKAIELLNNSKRRIDLGSNAIELLNEQFSVESAANQIVKSLRTQ